MSKLKKKEKRVNRYFRDELSGTMIPPHEFLQKAWETYQEAKNEIYILFPIEFITTARFHKSVGGGRLFVPNGRINFQSGLGKKGKSPAFGSVVMKIQDTWEIELINIK